jgi:hypothetical protein
VNFLSAPLYVSPGQVKISIDTFEEKYSIKLVAKLAFIDEDGIGLELGWKGDKLSKINLIADIPINTNICGVPVTYSKFIIGADGIDNSIPVWGWTLTGQMTISAAKISALLPNLEKYVGDVSVCSIDEVKATLTPKDGYFRFDATFKLLEKVELGKVELEAGKFKYTNLLLGMDKATVTGFRIMYGRGIKWKSNNCDIDLGAKAEITLTNSYVGAKAEGVCSVMVKWWKFKKGIDIRGEGLVGFYADSDGDMIFTVRARSSNSASNKRNGVCLTWAKNNPPQIDTKFY